MKDRSEEHLGGPERQGALAGICPRLLNGNPACRFSLPDHSLTIAALPLLLCLCKRRSQALLGSLRVTYLHRLAFLQQQLIRGPL